MKTVMDAASPDDASLIATCLKGDRDAFGLLVKRYQSLVCALTYSRCGDVAQSEDLAQETFLAAWKSLPSLQQGGNFKRWLCQIARNVSASAVRRDAGKPHGHSSRIEDAPELVDGKNSPVSEAISREEEEVVWRTLETLPENYRLPLILFHREGESISAVAAALDLSEDAVKQRLARGREMLKQEVNSVIEGTLQRMNPGTQFTAAAIAGIESFGGATAKAAGIGTVATSSAVVAKTFVGTGIFWMGIVPIIGEWLTYFIISKQARTHEERSIFKRYAIYGSSMDDRVASFDLGTPRLDRGGVAGDFFGLFLWSAMDTSIFGRSESGMVGSGNER